MRQLLAVPALFALLASCQSPAQMQAQDDNFCRSIGANGSTYTQCMMQRDAMRREERARRSAAMLAASAQIMSTPTPRQTTTTCNRVGQSVVCNSF